MCTINHLKGACYNSGYVRKADQKVDYCSSLGRTRGYIIRWCPEGQGVNEVPAAEDEPPEGPLWTFKSQSGNRAMSLFWTFREGRRSVLTAIC